MADTMSSADERETLRDAVLAGDMSPEEAVAQLPEGDPWRGAFEVAAGEWAGMAERPNEWRCVLPPVDERRASDTDGMSA